MTVYCTQQSAPVTSSLVPPEVHITPCSSSSNTTCNDVTPQSTTATVVTATATSQVLPDDDKCLALGLTSRTATPEELVGMAVECFDREGDVIEDKRSYPSMLCMMHQWFMASDELANICLKLYSTCDSHVECRLTNCQHKSNSTDCALTQYRTKICHFIKFWIREYPMHFDLSASLNNAVQKLQERVKLTGLERLHKLVDTSKVPSYEWMRSVSVRNPARSSKRGSGRVSLVFQHIQAPLLAEQLTVLEYKAFRRISFTELREYGHGRPLKELTKLERSVAIFNGLSQWIQCMVLSKTTPQHRSDVIEKFINVAKRLRELQNFNTLMAVVGGVTHSSLARLGKTNTCLPESSQETLMELTELLSASNNYSSYRKELGQSTGFKIPILGIHLKDIVQLHTAHHNELNDGLLNVRKMGLLFHVFKDLMAVEQMPLPVEENTDLCNTLKLALDMHYTEEEIYELSLAREPRNSLSSPSTPTKPVLFADWCAGVSPPNPETISNHIREMVEAVFKNYDHDKDGFISHAEFEAIAGNFPFIDSFCVLDADQDGLISKSEMKSYFNRANCNALRNTFKLNFKHEFHETTYFRPTYCIHCTGLCRGIIRQGWKCRGCGVNAHRQCKDLVVVECRPKTNSGINHGRSQSVSGSRDVGVSVKRKMSQRHKRVRRCVSTQTTETYVSDLTNPAKEPVLLRKSSAEQTNRQLKLSRQASLDTAVSRHTALEQEAEDELTGGGSACVGEGQLGEAARLLEENKLLKQQVDAKDRQIGSLKSHISLIRQHTVNFLVNHMGNLQSQRNTDV